MCCSLPMPATRMENPYIQIYERCIEKGTWRGQEFGDFIRGNTLITQDFLDGRHLLRIKQYDPIVDSQYAIIGSISNCDQRFSS